MKKRKGSQVRTVGEAWFTDLLNQAQAIVTSKEMLKVRADEYLKPMLVEIGTWNSKGAKPEAIIATVKSIQAKLGYYIRVNERTLGGDKRAVRSA